MTEEILSKDDETRVYEIGYILVSSIPEEKVALEGATLKEILTKHNAEIIAEEAPELRSLAYDMVKKIGSQNHTFDKGYFGWVKFILPGSIIEQVKKEFEQNPNVLRILLITTIRDNTYLGKKTPAVFEPTVNAEAINSEVAPVDAIVVEEKPASVEEMDKSIDEMVKEA